MTSQTNWPGSLFRLEDYDGHIYSWISKEHSGEKEISIEKSVRNWIPVGRNTWACRILHAIQPVIPVLSGWPYGSSRVDACIGNTIEFSPVVDDFSIGPPSHSILVTNSNERGPFFFATTVHFRQRKTLPSYFTKRKG